MKSFSGSDGHIPIFVDAILNDQEVIIHGDGKQTHSMTYVDDLVEGTYSDMVAEEAVGEIFKLDNDEETSVLDAAFLIHRIASTGKEIRHRDMSKWKKYLASMKIEETKRFAASSCARQRMLSLIRNYF
jgi:nucleoside-diphosphate-sugar epimerase